MSEVDADVLTARAFLSRVAEPGSVAVWDAVRTMGALAAVDAIRNGTATAEVARATAARAATVDPAADLDVANRHGIRLVVPESDDWPHFAFAALEAIARRLTARPRDACAEASGGGDLVPPLALWVRGQLDLTTIGTRAVALVGARAATEYGEWVARDLAARLGSRGFTIISGGAHGVDTAAHRGALAANAATVLISAGGLDRAYPPANTHLFEQVAESGLLVSESPPGAAPQRRRFLTRNRLIAAFGTGTVVVEAAWRSGALNTAAHCTRLGRPLMAVPGPVTSAMSAGCHRLLAAREAAHLVTSADDVVDVIGSSSELSREHREARRPSASGDRLTGGLDDLDPSTRLVHDGFPARGWTTADRLSITTGLPTVTVLRALPLLEAAGLIESAGQDYRIRPTVDCARRVSA